MDGCKDTKGAGTGVRSVIEASAMRTSTITTPGEVSDIDVQAPEVNVSAGGCAHRARGCA